MTVNRKFKSCYNIKILNRLGVNERKLFYLPLREITAAKRIHVLESKSEICTISILAFDL